MHEEEADMRVSAQCREKVGMLRLDVLEHETALLAHQIDEAEVPRAEHDDVAIAHPRLAMRRLHPGRLLHRMPYRRVVLVAAADTRHLPDCKRSVHQLFEPV